MYFQITNYVFQQITNYVFQQKTYYVFQKNIVKQSKYIGQPHYGISKGMDLL